MSTGIITATSFFADNGLFKLLEHKDGEMNKSYKTKNQNYIMECLDCGEQIEQRGNAKFECRRCRRFVSPTIEDGQIVWYIDEPSGLKKSHADEAMKRDPKILVAPGISEEVDEESEEEEPAPKLPKPSEMVSFLKKTAKSTTGNRVITRKSAEKAAADEDITEDVEPIIPAAKTKGKKVEKPKDHPVSETCPEVEKVMMSVVRLKPGQNFYCKITNTMYLVDSE